MSLTWHPTCRTKIATIDGARNAVYSTSTCRERMITSLGGYFEFSCRILIAALGGEGVKAL